MAAIKRKLHFISAINVFLQSEFEGIKESSVALEGGVEVGGMANTRNGAQLQQTSILTESPRHPLRLRDEHVELRGEYDGRGNRLQQGVGCLAGEQQRISPVNLKVLKGRMTGGIVCCDSYTFAIYLQITFIPSSFCLSSNVMAAGSEKK